MNESYITLVKALLNPNMTPEVRKAVLAKLTAMNNELLSRKEIDLDDLLDDIEEKSELDKKLERIAELQKQLIDSRKRHKK